MKKFNNLKTWLGYLNFFILQWFFIRLEKYIVPEIKEVIDFHELIATLPNNKFGIGGNAEIKTIPSKTKYKFLYGIVPLTGWWSDYKYIKELFK